jgi:diguanylate cyclase (GGDEF)-like protein
VADGRPKSADLSLATMGSALDREALLRWALWLGGVYVGVATLVYVLPAHEVLRRAVEAVVLAVGPLAAGAACVQVARKAPPFVRTAWSIIAIGTLLALIGQLISGVDLIWGNSSGERPAAAVLFVIFEITLAIGTAIALRIRERGLVAEIALDAALILLAAAAVVLRYAPGVAANLERTPAQLARQVGTLLGTLAGPFAAICALTFSGLLLFWRESPVSRAVAIGLAGAALSFATLDGIVAFSGAPMGDPVIIDELVRLAGWGFLTFAAVAAIRTQDQATSLAEPTRFATRMRQAVVPASVFFICVAWVDAALNPPGRVEVNLALAVMGALVMVRVTQLLQTAHQEAVQRQELAHTRALVEVSQALAGSKELNQTLDLVSVWASRLLDARAATIELLSEDGDYLELRTGFNLPADLIGMRFPVNGSFTGSVVRTSQPRVTGDVSGEPEYNPPSSDYPGKATLAAYMGNAPMAAAPLRYRTRVVGALAVLGSRPFDRRQLELLGALADQAALAIENARLFEQVTALSLTDPLTGLANRRQLDRDLAREFAAAVRGRKLVCVLFDIDRFKEYNDRHGHLAGDEALRLFARALTSETRAMNLAVRYGGDEFIVLLADADVSGADIFVRRVRQRFPPPDSVSEMAELSVAAGYAEYRPEMSSPEELIAEADLALYQDKARRSKKEA